MRRPLAGDLTRQGAAQRSFGAPKKDELMDESTIQPPSAPSMLLDIQHLSVQFDTPEGRVRALRGVSLQLYDGETLALLGESGSGREELAQAILRILPRHTRLEGKILLRRDSEGGASEWLDLVRLRERQVVRLRGQDIAIWAPEPRMSLSPLHTVGGQIAESIRIYRRVGKREAQAQAVALLTDMGIPNPAKVAESYPSALSPWLRQRLLLASAVAGNPRLLIVDDPTRGVDTTQQALLLELLHELDEKLGLTMLVGTDNPAVAIELADRVAVMYLGSIVETASKADLLAGPRHPYTQGLLRTVLQAPDGQRQRLWAMEGMTPPAFASIRGCPFHNRCRLFIPGICDVSFPGEVEIKPGHRVACYRYNPPPKPA